MWKNKRAEEPVSAKIKGAAKKRAKQGRENGNREATVESLGPRDARKSKKDADKEKKQKAKRQELKEVEEVHHNEEIRSDSDDDNFE